MRSWERLGFGWPARIAGLLLLCVWFGASIGDETPAAPTQVLVFGDSLSAAYQLPSQAGWVAGLRERLDERAPERFEVTNASVSGETTSGGKQRLARLMHTHRPSVLVLELGANDALRGQNLAVTEQNLQAMIDLCLQAEFACQVVLLGIRLPPNYGPVYNAQLDKMYQRLADRNLLLFDPFFLEPVALEAQWMQYDGLHPNAQAQPQILERVLPLIHQALQRVRGLDKEPLQ